MEPYSIATRCAPLSTTLSERAFNWIQQGHFFSAESFIPVEPKNYYLRGIIHSHGSSSSQEKCRNQVISLRYVSIKWNKDWILLAGDRSPWGTGVKRNMSTDPKYEGYVTPQIQRPQTYDIPSCEKSDSMDIYSFSTWRSENHSPEGLTEMKFP